MTALQTARFSIPLLAAGQAHKELFHNEALTLLDFLIHPVVEDIVDDPQTLVPSEGDCWLVGSTPVGDWAEFSNNIAGWTAGGWRFISPRNSMTVTVATESKSLVYDGNTWLAAGAIDTPSGGQVVDFEARAAIDSILTALQTYGILSSQP